MIDDQAIAYASDEPVGEREWYRRPLRVIQTILRTCDAKGYDAEEFIDFAVRNHANAVVINGGGLQAFYPSSVPGHPVVDGLEGDIVHEVTDRAHAAGLKVLARVDFRAGTPEHFAEHPDWFARDENGDPRFAHGLHPAAATSPYRAEGFGFRVVSELLGRYDLDGIWENAPGFLHIYGKRKAYGGPLIDVLEHGREAAEFTFVDYSERTAARFAEDTGRELPHPDRFAAEDYLAYMEWRYAQVTARCSAMRDLVKSFGSGLAYVAEAPGAVDPSWSRIGALDMSSLAPIFDIMAAPTFGFTRDAYQSTLRPSPVWRPTEVVSHMRAAKPDTTPTIMFGRFDNLSRYTTLTPVDLELWLLAGLAQGAGNWECTFVGRSDQEFHDRRADDVVDRHYARIAKLEPFIDGADSVAEVAVVHSRRTETLFGATDPLLDRSVQHTHGVVAALLGAHVQFDLVPDEKLLGSLAKYKVLVLPQLQILDDAQVSAVRTFVESGGGIVVTGALGVRDGSGERVSSPLNDVLGIAGEQRIAQNLGNAYGFIESRSDVTTGLEGTDMVTTQGAFRIVEPQPAAEVPMTLVEHIDPQPPEWGWIDLEAGHRPPFVVSNTFGKGRSVYFAGEVDRHISSSGHPDHARLLVNAVRAARGGESDLVDFRGPSAVHMSVLRNAPDKLLVSLVNYGSAPGRPLVEVLPVHGVEVHVGVGALRSIRRASDALTDSEFEFSAEEDGVVVRIPRVEIFQTILLEGQA